MTKTNEKERDRLWANVPPRTKAGFMATVSNLTITEGIAVDAKGRDVTDRLEIKPVLSERRVRASKARDEFTLHSNANGGFVLAFFKQSRTITDRFPTLTQQDTARLLFIGTYVQWETTRIVYDNGRPMTKKQLGELVGMNPARWTQLYNRFVDAEVITATEDGDLYLNPTVIYRGELKNLQFDVSQLTHTRIFRTTVRDLYAQCNGRQLGQLGLIYAVLPFLNYRTNVICWNPEERSEELLQPMTVSKLAIALEYSNAQKLKTALNKVKVDGYPVFTFVEDVDNRKEKRIIVNPNVVFAGGGEALAAVKVLFNQSIGGNQ